MDEFSLIKQYFSTADSISGTDVILGIGDDTAILQPADNEELLITTDTLISSVHFPEETAPIAIGHKALAVNLSDIAAMGGDPRWFTLALSLPQADPDWLEAFSDGLLTLSKQYSVSLVGGDTTRGPLSITLSVIGTVPKGRAIKRTGASTGDIIYVTGCPGMAAIGLAALNGEIGLADTEKNKFLNKLDYPQPRLREGLYLRDYASSMIDISDGLAADLQHILLANNCSAVVDAVRLSSWGNSATNLTKEMILEAALYGGDDYELLFTVPAEKASLLEQSWNDSFSALTRIGEITEGEGVSMTDHDGKLIKVSAHGYNHFHD